MSDDELRRVMGVLMGWHLYGPASFQQWYDDKDQLVRSYDGWNPLTDANDALRVVEAMEKKGWLCSIDTNNKEATLWRVIAPLSGWETRFASFESVLQLPRAICEAAAKAEGVWHE